MHKNNCICTSLVMISDYCTKAFFTFSLVVEEHYLSTMICSSTFCTGNDIIAVFHVRPSNIEHGTALMYLDLVLAERSQQVYFGQQHAVFVGQLRAAYAQVQVPVRCCMYRNADFWSKH